MEEDIKEDEITEENLSQILKTLRWRGSKTAQQFLKTLGNDGYNTKAAISKAEDKDFDEMEIPRAIRRELREWAKPVETTPTEEPKTPETRKRSFSSIGTPNVKTIVQNKKLKAEYDIEQSIYEFTISLAVHYSEFRALWDRVRIIIEILTYHSYSFQDV